MPVKSVPVIIFGAGGVGQALLRQIVRGRDHLQARNGLRFDVVAVADSKSWLWAPAGLSDEELLAAVAAKANGRPLGAKAQAVLPAEEALAAAPRGEQQALTVKSQQQLADLERRPDTAVVAEAAAAGIRGALVVDVTAQAGMEPVLDQALALGYGVALANKKALAGPWASAQKYYHEPRLRHESTVGGGQPVVATLRYLLDTGDPIRRIEGQLSGTLGFICQQLDAGTPFSQALATAKARGYTEPDPREDLGGQDVMRKIMILGRMAGWPLEAADIYVESLYPTSLAHLAVPEFMAAAVAIDPGMDDRVAAAAASGEVLRYLAELEDGRASVSLKAIPVDSALSNMKYVSFQTDHYHDEPLVIGGKGAGVEMTAAGVLGDMIALGRATA